MIGLVKRIIREIESCGGELLFSFFVCTYSVCPSDVDRVQTGLAQMHYVQIGGKAVGYLSVDRLPQEINECTLTLACAF